MTKADEVSRLAAYADSHLKLSTACLAEEHYYASLPLCVIDAVYSISVRYESVQAVVRRYCRRFDLPRVRRDPKSPPAREEQESVSGFCKRFEEVGLETMTNDVFANKQRTSPRSGILKADAVFRFASALRGDGVERFQDVAGAFDDDLLAQAIRSIPGQRSGVSLQYFLMLAGSDEFVKPDRMVVRFLEGALGRDVAVRESQNLLSAAAERLKPKHPHLTTRLLDYTVWQYQREQQAEGQTAVVKCRRRCERSCD